MLSCLCDHDGLSPGSGEMMGLEFWLQTLCFLEHGNLNEYVANSLKAYPQTCSDATKRVALGASAASWHGYAAAVSHNERLFWDMQGKCTGIRGVLSRDTIRDSSETPRCSAVL